MIRRALAFLIREGPASPQDHWEEDDDLNPYTLAVCIAALVASAELLPEPERKIPLLLADFWNARLEDWCVARGTGLDATHGIAAHYVREAPPEILACPAALSRHLPIKNRAKDPGLDAAEQIGSDFLQLVRLGLRRADDPLILDSPKLVDALLKTDTPSGPVWHRYTGDGYGEHVDGASFDGSGQGASARCWWVSAAIMPWVDRREAVWHRHHGRRPVATTWVWTLGAPLPRLANGCALLILLPRAALLRLGFDGWQAIHDLPSQPLGLELHGVTLAADFLHGRRRLDFTWQWREGNWQSEDFGIDLAA